MNITDIKGCTILSNGVNMPYFGLGVYLVNNGKEVINVVNFALEAGYRHIDTASLYDNESGVGKAVRESAIPRSEVFVTSKVWDSDQGYDSTLRAFEKSLRLLGFDYLDLYLIHWPVHEKFKDTWKALETLYKEKSIKAIGVSNFLISQLDDLLASAEIVPMVNQVEFHPYLVQQPLIDFCVKNNIQFESWSPLMQGNIVKIDLLNQLAKKYQKTTAQIGLR